MLDVKKTRAENLNRIMTLKWLGTGLYNLQDLETFYQGQQTMERNGLFSTEQIKDPDYNRFYDPMNFCQMVNDEPVGYLADPRVKIDHLNPKLEAWANDFYTRRIKPRLGNAIRWGSLYGESFLYFQVDKEGLEKKLRVEVRQLIENGKQMIYLEYSPTDPEEVVAALVYRLVPTTAEDGSPSYHSERVWLTATEFYIERGIEGIGTPRDEPSKWVAVRSIPNRLGHLPLARYENPTPSDILHFIPVQKRLDKLEVEIDYTLEFQGFPMIATTANSADGLKVGAGRILFGGDAKRIEGGSTEWLNKRKEDLLESGSKIAKSPKLYQQRSASVRSGDAEEHLKDDFYNKLQEKAANLAPTVVSALRVAALMLSKDKALLAYETRFIPEDLRPNMQELATAEFTVALEASIPVNEEQNAKIASIYYNELDVSHSTALAKAGVANPDAEVEKFKKESGVEEEVEETEDGTLEGEDLDDKNDESEEVDSEDS